MSAIIASMKEKIIAPCLEEEERYYIRSRKILSIAVSVAIMNSIGFSIAVSALTINDAPTTYPVYLKAAALFYAISISAVFPYFYMRATKKLPDWLMDLQMWATIPASTILSLYNNHEAVVVLVACSTLISVVVQIRGWSVMLAFGICLNALHALINNFQDVLPTLNVTFQTPDVLSVRIIYLVGTNSLIMFAFGLGLYGIMKEFVEKSDQADAAIAMNLAVADKLRRYDTDGVAVILAANKGKVDENLLEAFTAIQHNLQEYRPHIPDYVIAATVDTTSTRQNDTSVCEEDDDDEEDSIQEDLNLEDSGRSAKCSASNNTPIFAPTPIAHHQPSLVLDHDNDATNDRSDSDDTSTVTSVNMQLQNDQSKALINRSSIPSAHDESAAIKQRQHYYGKVTTVFVRFVSEACGSDGSGNGSVPKSSNVAAMMALSRCVEAASKLAKLFHGALQYMQGCGLMVSFNATSRVATHEAKACAFADALRLEVDGMRSTSPVVMHASVVTSPNVLSFFAGNSGQLMLTVLGSFMPQHTAMHHYLSQTVGMVASCVLLTDHVVSTVDMTYETRRLGAISLSSALSSPNTILSQLLGQRSHGHNDEWMYNMQSASATDATTTITNCLVDVAIESGTPPQIPDDIVAMTPSDIVLERCVVSRLQACHDSKGTQQFTIHTAPTVMW